MPITQAICTSFKRELFEGQHDFRLSGGDTFNIALFTSSATLNATTTDYAVTNEASGTGYSAGGQALTRVDPATSGTTAYIDFADETFSSVSITARGALIYNATLGTNAVMVLDFGVDKVASSQDFTIQFPTADASNAIIRIE